jgi:flagellin-like hook-associated protein FlgL
MSLRITDNYLSALLVGDLNRSLSGLLEQQRRAGSLQRINSYADDPRAVSTIQRLDALISQNDSYLANISRSRTLLDGTDMALQDLSGILADVRILAMRESSSLANGDTMATAAFEVDSHVGRLLEVLNTSLEGHFIFAGRRTDQAPFVQSGGSVQYLGDSGEIFGRTGPNATLPLNIPGDVFMGSQAASLSGSVNLGPVLRGSTLLSDLNLGAGWQPGSLAITAGDGTTYRVDLSGAVTVGDVISRIQEGTRGVVSAAIAANGQGLVLAGQPPLAVGEVGDGSTAQSLGIHAASLGGTLLGSDIRTAPDRDTLLGEIQALSGHVPLGTVEITWEGGTTTVDLRSAQTLGDVQDLFAGATPPLELVFDGGTLRVVGPGPAAFSLSDGDTTGAASALGIQGEGMPTRLFGVMEDLRTALMAGDKDAVQGVIGELLALSQTVSGLLVRNGGRQNDLDWAEGVLLHRDERLRSNLSLERDVDVAQVAADLSRAEASYQASLLVTSRLFENNLIQYLS